MIRRILISLADDETSHAAARVTLDLARRFQAGVTSLATVDVGTISSAALAPSIGATYFAHDLVLQMDERLSSTPGRCCPPRALLHRAAGTPPAGAREH